MTYLFRYMPRRDMILLFNHPIEFTDYLVQHVRYAIITWPWASNLGVGWDVFLENVVPYAILDEKRDVSFRWRPRLYQALAPLVAEAPNLTAAAHAVVAAVPTAQLAGALATVSGSNVEALVPGQPVSWKSETSVCGDWGMRSIFLGVDGCACCWIVSFIRCSLQPAYLSPEQTVQFGGL
jgi:hypothetical protein